MPRDKVATNRAVLLARRAVAAGVWLRLLRGAMHPIEMAIVAEEGVPDPGFAADRGQALHSFAGSRVSPADVVARTNEVPDPGAGPPRRYPVTRGSVNTIRTPPATFSAETVPPILAM